VRARVRPCIAFGQSRGVMKVLLCGAAGFTGRAILEELIAAGHSVRAWDLKPESFVADGIDDAAVLKNPSVELTYGSIADYDLTRRYVSGCDAVVHTTVVFQGDQGGAGVPGEFAGDEKHNTLSWIVNLKVRRTTVSSAAACLQACCRPCRRVAATATATQCIGSPRHINHATEHADMHQGLWNVLDCARVAGCQRVVHVGSCQHMWPGAANLKGKETAGSQFFSGDVRRPDASQYAVHKRLQEEMCRQFYDGHGLRTIVLRPSGIIDVPQRLFRDRRKLSRVWSDSWVSRHQLGQAACAALRSGTADFFVLHAVTLPSPRLTSFDAREVCNVGDAPAVLDGFDFTMDVRQFGYVGSSTAAKL
jgi:nucleoside-diphosphate-sugar epimerase